MKLIFSAGITDDDEIEVHFNPAGIEELNEAFLAFMNTVYDDDRLGNAWNFAIERFADDRAGEEIEYYTSERS